MKVDENAFFREALRESEERHRVTLQIVEENRLASEVEMGSLSRMIRGKEWFIPWKLKRPVDK